MTTTKTKPRLTSFAPQFLVDDLARSMAYYQKLGFTFGEPWDGFYAIGQLDGLELHLKEAPRSADERRHRRENEHLDAAAGVDGIEAFHAQCVANGATIIKPLAATPWGTKDFYVEDPDGHIVSFGGRPAAAHTAPVDVADSSIRFSKSRIWTGRIISTLVVLFLAFDAITKLIREPHVMAAATLMGLTPAMIVTIGAILSVCLAIHLVPRLSLVGAVLLTGYLGGAAATNMVVKHPFFECLFPVIFGALVWLGLYLRDCESAVALDETELMRKVAGLAYLITFCHGPR